MENVVPVESVSIPPEQELEAVRLRPLDVGSVRPVMAAPGSRDSLPWPLSSFVGREAEIAAARAFVADGRVRLLTLIGPGGVGKTRLAIRLGEEAAAAFADGVVFVSLAAIADPELVAPAIARDLGLREVSVESPAERVAAYLRDRRVLLILDNVEQVQSAAPRIAALLAACPGVVAVATSRVPLNVVGEQRLPVEPLPLPTAGHGDGAGRWALDAIAASPAVQLFVTRAEAVDPWFALDDGNAEAIAAICRRLDGLPLAIELAAARTHVLEPADLLARLSPALPLLTKGPDDAPDRLRTMRGAIAWSHDLLTAEEQRLFRRLAVFAGGFTLDAAEAVGRRESDVARTTGRSAFDSRPPTSDSVLGLVASLVDKSLVQRTTSAGGSRFAMLETIREFALEQLAASGEAEDIAGHHAAWCVALAEEVRQSGRLSHRDGLALLEAEHPNLRAALAWLLERDEAAALYLAGELAEFWMRHGHWVEGGAWLERLLAANDGGATAERASALVGLSMLMWARRDFALARALLDEAEATARAVGDAGALAYARLHQGYVATFSGDFDLALARGEECLHTCHAIPQGFSCNGALWLLARATLARGENDRARQLHERLLAASQTQGDDISVANALLGLGILAERRGDLAQALTGFVDAATTCLRFGDAMFLGYCFDLAGMAAVAAGRPEPAVRLFAAVKALQGSIGIAPGPSLHVDPEGHQRAVDAARAALGDERFARAWADGAVLTRDAAIAEIVALADEARAASGALALPERDLTPRERDVLRLVAQGWSDKEIAAALGIGRRTASTHVAAIRAKLGAASRSAAAAIAARDRLV
mgnify:CR=1 FL=1